MQAIVLHVEVCRVIATNAHIRIAIAPVAIPYRLG